MPAADRAQRQPASEGGEAVRVQAAVDYLNRQFGRDTVRTARQGHAEKHRLRAEKKSRCFTTRWDELLKVHGRRLSSWSIARTHSLSILHPDSGESPVVARLLAP